MLSIIFPCLSSCPDPLVLIVVVFRGTTHDMKLAAETGTKKEVSWSCLGCGSFGTRAPHIALFYGPSFIIALRRQINDNPNFKIRIFYFQASLHYFFDPALLKVFFLCIRIVFS